MAVMAVVFTIPFRAQGKGRPRFSRKGGAVRTHTPRATKAFENVVKHYAAQAMKGRAPLTGPIHLSVVAYFVPPASAIRKARADMLAGRRHPEIKPDFDNFAKAVADALQGIGFGDDKSITWATIGKRYGLADEICITIEGDE